jgi:molybdenum cofactor cytidylyltransferase
MAAALGTGPELVRCPRHAGSGIPHVHLCAAALTTNVAIDVGHGGDSNIAYDRRVIPAIVLAAGRSSRMGRLKPNLPAGLAVAPGDTFLTHIVRTLDAAGIDDVIIVVGHEMAAVAGSFAASGLSARFVENRDYASGQLSSLLAGLRLADRPGVVAALVTLVDVPFVSTATVRIVLERYQQTHAPIVRPVHNGRHGHPMLVDRSLFDRLRHADPREGAKPVVRANVTPAGEVEVDDEGAFADIDTPEDYERALSVFGGADRSRLKETRRD